MKNLSLILIFISFCFFYGYGQQKGYTYKPLPVYGKIFETPSVYHRVDTAVNNDMPAAVKKLYTHSAGLFVSFKTNATSVAAKWCVTDRKQGLNMTAIAMKGLDLYLKNSAGKWQYAGSKGTDKTCDDLILVENLTDTEKEFLLYLPLYDETKSLEIGVPDGASLVALPNPFQKNILVYGSSIVQGASAGRPGMTYTSIMSRRTGFNFVNFGVSGNARMEQEVAHMLADSSPDAIILDCVPNSLPEIIAERTAYFVEYLRAAHPDVPIIMIPSVVREMSYFNQVWNKRNAAQNVQYKKEYDALKAKGVAHLYYFDCDTLLGTDHEGTTDGTHPNDLGFMRMADQIQPFVLEILDKHKITLSQQ